MTGKLQIVFQTTNPRRLADFWRAALDYVTEPPPDGFNTWEQFTQQTGVDLSDSDIDAAVDPDGNGPRLLFERSDEVTTGNAVHLDVNVTQRGDEAEAAREAIDAKAAQLHDIGAQPHRVVDDDNRYWIEMTDVDGNWFCIQ